MTFCVRDVPFSDGSGIVEQILVGVCDQCKRVIAIPAQSTPKIKETKYFIDQFTPAQQIGFKPIPDKVAEELKRKNND